MASSRQQTQVNPIDVLVANIVRDRSTQDLLTAYGLRAHSVTWEDTGRSKGSCWGPNISDMTLVVKDGDRLMPVIRKPNFSDVTDDLPIETFTVRMGNEGADAKSQLVPLLDYLKNVGTHTDEKGNTVQLDLHCDRDTHVLTSSQCCVIPVPTEAKTEFAVQLFNYQSYDEDPAVLVILASKDGVSTQIVQRSNQKLFFNDKGTSRWFTAERLQDYRTRKTGKKQDKVKSFTEMKEDEKLENVIMMIQVPLKQKPRPKTRGGGFFAMDGGSYNMAAACAFGVAEEEECCEDFGLFGDSPPVYRSMNLQSHVKGVGMDMGMIGLGSEEGPFVGTNNLKLERDDRFPIRCTFQYYRVTDENFINEHDVKDISVQVSKATTIATASGSLVTNEDTGRVTEPNLKNPLPSDNPFGKVVPKDERDYLKQVQQVQATASTEWCGTGKKLASFM